MPETLLQLCVHSSSFGMSSEITFIVHGSCSFLNNSTPCFFLPLPFLGKRASRCLQIRSWWWSSEIDSRVISNDFNPKLLCQLWERSTFIHRGRENNLQPLVIRNASFGLSRHKGRLTRSFVKVKTNSRRIQFWWESERERESIPRIIV